MMQASTGRTVTWPRTHNATRSAQGGVGRAHAMKLGRRASIAFENSGEGPDVCTDHGQNTTGTVIVPTR